MHADLSLYVLLLKYVLVKGDSELLVKMNGIYKYFYYGLFKGIVHPKMNICGNINSPSGHLICDTFVCSSEQMDPLQWMGDKKHDRNPLPVHQLKSYEVKSCVFVVNKSISKTFLTSNRCFWLNFLYL